MQVSMNTVVTMTYELKDADGVVLESSDQPVAYLHGGYDNIFPKVEEAMHGKNIGDTIELALEPADAFGEYDETPEEMGEQIEEYLKKDLINIIGGCCGTSPEHIRVIANIAAKYKPRRAELVSASH